jgi:hypothetical protein
MSQSNLIPNVDPAVLKEIGPLGVAQMQLHFVECQAADAVEHLKAMRAGQPAVANPLASVATDIILIKQALETVHTVLANDGDARLWEGRKLPPPSSVN